MHILSQGYYSHIKNSEINERLGTQLLFIHNFLHLVHIIGRAAYKLVAPAQKHQIGNTYTQLWVLWSHDLTKEKETLNTYELNSHPRQFSLKIDELQSRYANWRCGEDYIHLFICLQIRAINCKIKEIKSFRYAEFCLLFIFVGPGRSKECTNFVTLLLQSAFYFELHWLTLLLYLNSVERDRQIKNVSPPSR